MQAYTDKRRGANKAWYYRNRERILARDKAYREANRAKIAHRKRAQRQATKETQRERDSRYRASERGKMVKAASDHKRRKWVRSGSYSVTGKELAAIRKAANGVCHYCGKTAKLTFDHVIPLSRGGEHVSGNIVCACRPCNSSKHAKLNWCPS